MNGLLRLLLASGFPLFFDEAYYWEWSRYLSLGYLDNPPMVAYIIRLSTELFGSKYLLGIRFFALLLGTGTHLLVYRLAIILFNDKRVAARSLIFASTLPLMNAMGALTLSETPLLFFFLLFLCFFASALRWGRTRDWCLAGLALGLALQSELDAIFMLLAAAGFLILYRQSRSTIHPWRPLLTLLLALLVWSPFLYWNSINEWATFRLHSSDFLIGQFEPRLLKIPEFFIEQLANTSFLLAIPMFCLPFIRLRTFPQPWRDGYQLLKFQSVFPLFVILVLGLFGEGHPNRTLLAYPPLCVALAAWSAAKPNHFLTRPLKILTILTVVIFVLLIFFLLFALNTIEEIDVKTPDRGFGRIFADTQERLFGFNKLADQLKQSPVQIGELYFTDDPRLGAILSFELQGKTVINIGSMQSQTRRRGDAQLFYIPWTSLAGKDGVFITKAQHKEKMSTYLREVFERVEEMSLLEVKLSKSRSLFYCQFHVTGFRALSTRGVL